jgi:hypothetical protein
MALPAVSRLATWSVAAPLVCAVHCLVTPVVVVVLPVARVADGADGWLFAGTAIVAVAAGHAGARRHRCGWVWVPLLAGLATWAAALTGLGPPAGESWVVTAGALSVAVGLVWNLRLQRRPARCGCDVCGSEKGA